MIASEPQSINHGTSNMPQGKRLLMIAYHFPPVQVSSGIQRTLKFCTYLRAYGWEPLVLTISPRGYRVTSTDQIQDIPPNVIVERAFGLDTSRHLAIGGKYLRWMAQPDPWVSWWPSAVWTGMRMIQRFRPNAIFSTFPIATAHLIGLSLCKRSGLPWVADFRDAMTEGDYPGDPMTRRVHRWIERATIKHCRQAVFTTEATRQMYAERYPKIHESHFTVIENGFDEENFRDAEANLSQIPLGAPGQLTLVHSGALYPMERDPRPFFSALAMLKSKGVINRARLQIVLRATSHDNLYKPLITDLGLGDIVRLEPVIPYRAALEEMLRADGLLLFQAACCNHQIPAKIYEYFRSGRPIFGLVDSEGVSARMLTSANVATVTTITDAKEIARTLSAFMDDLTQGRSTGVAKSFAMTHSRESRTKELATLLDSLANSA